MYTSKIIAKYFLYLAKETRTLITQMKLQKLVYYSQAWYLANFDEPLFNEDFEAWVYGPVEYSLYQQYKDFKYDPINTKDIKDPDIKDSDKKFLKEVADVYMPCNTYELQMMTHQEAPWKEARKGLPDDEPSRNIISKDSMKRYYKERLQDDED